MNIVITYRRTSRLSMRIGKNGEVRVSVPYGLTKSQVMAFIESHRDWISQHTQQRLQQEQQRQNFYDQLSLRTKAERQAATARLDAVILPLVRHHAPLMGVTPTRITYRATRSRWGSCNVRTGEICFSAYLLLLPDWCIEHVVVHELAHLLVPNHSKAFHDVMTRFFPRWKEARRETKRICGNMPQEG